MDWNIEASSSSAGMSSGLSPGLLTGGGGGGGGLGLSAGAAATRGGGGGKAAALAAEMATATARPGFSSGVKVQSNMKPVTSCPSLGELGRAGGDDRRSRR